VILDRRPAILDEPGTREAAGEPKQHYSQSIHRLEGSSPGSARRLYSPRRASAGLARYACARGAATAIAVATNVIPTAAKRPHPIAP
jgi:hypothetical protein